MLCAFGIDVLDPSVSLRRLWVLVRRFPPWVRSLGEPWSAEADLLALVVDHLAQLSWITVRVYGGTNASRPRPLPRPARASVTSASRSEPLSEPQGGKRAGSWADAARTLAAIPGVVVKDGG